MVKIKTKAVRFSVSPEKYELIKDYAKQYDMKIAEFCRSAVMGKIIRHENIKHCPGHYITKRDQESILTKDECREGLFEKAKD